MGQERVSTGAKNRLQAGYAFCFKIAVVVLAVVFYVSVASRSILDWTVPKTQGQIDKRMMFEPGSVVVPIDISKTWTHNLTYYLPPPASLCSHSPQFIFVVLSAPQNVEQRTAIRLTWGSIAKENPLKTIANTSLVFLLGRQPDVPGIQENISQEYARHGDIVQGNFHESFKNITYKSVLGLKFVSDFCKASEFLVKVDDDVFINPYELFPLAPYGQTNTMSGMVHAHTRVARGGKWAVRFDEYNETFYPPYLNGPVFMATLDVVPRLYDLAMRTQFFVIDDAYLTGMLASKLKVHLLDTFTRKVVQLMHFNLPRACDVMKKAAYHQVQADQQYRIWDYLQAARRGPTTCPY